MNALNKNHYRHWYMHACVYWEVYLHMCFCWIASLPIYTVKCSPQVERYELVESILLGSYYQESTQVCNVCAAN